MANLEQAKKVFNDLAQMFEKRNWKCVKHEDDLVITSGVQGDDLPVEFIIYIDAEKEVVRFLSKLPFSFNEERRIDGALAICASNIRILNGSFDYDVTNGQVYFRLCNSFKDGSTISESAFEYIVMVSAITVDNYNDKLFALSTGIISLEQFFEQIG